MFSYTGKTALVTGASSGIGEAFAQILAARGMNLVLVARSEEKLRALAQALSEQHGIRADVVPADLCREGAAQEVYRRTQGLGVPVDLLVNNAGFGTYGGFDTLALEREHEEIMLIAPTHIDHSAAAAGLPVGPAGSRQAIGMMLTGFPDLHVTVEDMIAEGDKVVVRLTMRGTQQGALGGIPPTGKQVAVSTIDIVRIE